MTDIFCTVIFSCLCNHSVSLYQISVEEFITSKLKHGSYHRSIGKLSSFRPFLGYILRVFLFVGVLLFTPLLERALVL